MHLGTLGFTVEGSLAAGNLRIFGNLGGASEARDLKASRFVIAVNGGMIALSNLSQQR